MANTVGVNKMSVEFPDACKAPSLAGPIPLSYANVARSADAAQGSKSVTVEGNPLCLRDSNFSNSTGDEAGMAGASSLA
ncbi:PAAR-like domain-containing protein [Myxococcus sp. Y35]|uniref:PAAR-like domain-containing protein n=1 Tax=Pseudomyxococcus flavus TaxID=3115648 RepID=UPI003CED430F